MKINNKNEIGKDVWGAPEGVISLTLARAVNAGARLVYVARDDARLASMRDLVLAVRRLPGSFSCQPGIACPMIVFRRKAVL